jgi:hypothetical protein
MMGRTGVGEEGIIPRLCQDLFNKIENDHDPDNEFSVEVKIENVEACLISSQHREFQGIVEKS